jgi:hypothetical protein
MANRKADLEKMVYDEAKKCYTCKKNGRDYTSTDGKIWFPIPTEVKVPKTGSAVKPTPESEVKLSDSYMHAHMNEALYTDTQVKLIDVLDGMKSLLLYKNRKYGDSAINPKKVFYKGDATNSILIRLDDKIGRVMSNTDDKPRVNDVADIIGYCTLLLVSMNVTSEDLKKFMD